MESICLAELSLAKRCSLKRFIITHASECHAKFNRSFYSITCQITFYSNPYTDFKSNQKFILPIRCFEVPFHRFKTGSALTAMLSIEHSSVPRRIRK